MARKSVTVRLPDELIDRLRKATDKKKKPYAPTKTQVFERGVDLALREIEKK